MMRLWGGLRKLKWGRGGRRGRRSRDGFRGTLGRRPKRHAAGSEGDRIAEIMPDPKRFGVMNSNHCPKVRPSLSLNNRTQFLFCLKHTDRHGLCVQSRAGSPGLGAASCPDLALSSWLAGCSPARAQRSGHRALGAFPGLEQGWIQNPAERTQAEGSQAAHRCPGGQVHQAPGRGATAEPNLCPLCLRGQPGRRRCSCHHAHT